MPHNDKTTEQGLNGVFSKSNPEMIKLLVETSSVAIAVVDAQGQVVFANKPGEELLGLQPSSKPGITYNHPVWRITDFNGGPFPDEKLPFSIVKKTLKPALGIRHAIHWPDGRRKLISINASPIFSVDGEFDGMLAYLEDLTAKYEAEQNYQMLFSQMIGGFAQHEIICDDTGTPVDYRFLQVNPAFERITGLQASDIIGKTAREVLPELENHWIEVYGKVALTGEPSFFESRAKELDKYFQVTAFQPAPEQFACIFTDITERKRSEKALKQSEEKFRALFASNPNGIALVETSSQRFLKANKSFLDMLGYGEEELCRLTVRDLTHPDDWEREIDQTQKHLGTKGSVFGITKRYLRKDGEIIWVRVTGDAIKLGETEPLLDIANVEDVTESLLAEEELRKQRQRLSGIIEGANVGTWEWNVQTGETLFNDRWAEIIGYSLEELAPISIKTWKRNTHPDDLKISNEKLQKHLDGEIEHYECECRMRHKEGHWVWGLDRGKVLSRTDDGKPLWVFGTRLDITDLKLAEGRLRASEERYRDIAKAQTGIIWEIDENFIVRHFSGRVGQILGYEPEEIIGRHPLFLVSPEDRERFESVLLEFPRKREPVKDFEYWCQAKNGRRVRFSTIGVSFFSSDGRFKGVRGTHLDITEAYLASLRRDVLLKIHTMIHDNDETISEVLCQACAEQTDSPFGLFGMVEPDESAMVAHVWSPLAMTEYLIPDKPIRLQVESAGPWAGPIRRREPVIINDYSSAFGKGGLPDGHMPIARYLGVPVVEGDKVIAVAGVANKRTEYDDGDIENLTRITRNVVDFLSKRYKDKSLHESEKRYRLTFDAIPDSITITRVKDGKYKYVNDGYTNLTGYSREEVIGKTPRDIDLYVNQADRRRMMKELKKAGVLQNFEVQFRKKDGTVWDSYFSARPIELDGENCLIALAKDVTELKKAEEEKRSLETQLRQAQKMEAIGTLAGGIAHDFNNILTAIIGYTELTMEDIPEGIPARPNLERIHMSALRARDLVKQILSFSRKSEYEKRPLRVESILKETLQLLRATVSTTIDIRQDIASDTGLVEADPTQIHQLILNLCTNAADAMKETGGTLMVGLEDVQVGQDKADGNIELDSGHYLKVTVQDTGPGIPAEILDRIFEPFFTTKEVGTGTGMGLSVVHGIVQGLGGAITVESAPGKGALFTIYLPVAETEGVRLEAKAKSDLIKGTGRVLFVDDEAALADLGEVMLARLGYTPTVKTSSLEALETFKSDPGGFDLIISDMAMPRMSGATLAGEILAIRPDIPIILCTGYSDQINGEKATKLGISRLLDKPLSIADLSRAIREAMG
jgi:PAS domain S-box-containing protein